MADNFSIQTQVQLLAGTTAEVNKTHACTGACAETFLSTISLAAAATGVPVTLGAITSPKMVVVAGAKGVGLRLGLDDTEFPANKVAVLSDEEGFTQDAIYLYNSDSQAHSVTVYAAE